MPIVFGSPTPIGSASMGNAQVMGQNNSTIAGLMRAVSEAYQNRQNNSVRLSIADQQSRQSGAETAYTQMNKNQNQQNQWGVEENIARGKNDTDLQQAQIAQQTVYEKQNREFTQADKIRLDKLKAGHAWVDAQGLDKESAIQMHSMIDAEMTPLKIQEANSKQKFYAEKQKELKQKNQFMADSQNQFDSMLVGAANSKIATVYDPDVQGDAQRELSLANPSFDKLPQVVQTQLINKRAREMGGVIGHYTLDANGKIVPLKKESVEKGDESKGMLTESQFQGIVGKEYDAHQKYLKELDPESQATWNSEGGVRNQQALANRLRDIHGLPTKYDEYKAMRSGKGGQQPPTPNPPPGPTQDKAAKSEEYQKHVDAELKDDHATIDAADVPGPVKAQAKQATTELAGIMKRYGGVPPGGTARQRAQVLMQMLQPLLNPQAQQPQDPQQTIQQYQPPTPQPSTTPGARPEANQTDPAVIDAWMKSGLSWPDFQKQLAASQAAPTQ